ncbi:hypothetical protein [Amycolatopsis sp. cmx-11-51]|uniref:hypothetical protein n=1 Tax=Amycolatopsis sp. cmx-11-51 TaxID=2785797 RepID=UPI0039E353C5
MSPEAVNASVASASSAPRKRSPRGRGPRGAADQILGEGFGSVQQRVGGEVTAYGVTEEAMVGLVEAELARQFGTEFVDEEGENHVEFPSVYGRVFLFREKVHLHDCCRHSLLASIASNTAVVSFKCCTPGGSITCAAPSNSTCRATDLSVAVDTTSFDPHRTIQVNDTPRPPATSPDIPLISKTGNVGVRPRSHQMR